VRSQRSSPDVGGVLGTRHRTTLWIVGLLLGLVAEWFARSGQGIGMVLSDLVVGWTLIACGLIAWSRRPRSRVGGLLTATGFAWFLGTLAGSELDIVAAFGAATLTLHRGPLFHAIIGFPSGRATRRASLAVIVLGYVYAAIEPIARNEVATIVVALLVLATTIRGYFVTAGVGRPPRVTAIASAAGVALVLVGGSMLRMSGTSPETDDALLLAYEAVLVLVAVGFLADLARGRWTQAAVTKLVLELGEPSEAGTLRDRLARALGDPSLLLAYWLPETGSYVDERGELIALPQPGSGRAVTVIERPDEMIGALVHDPAVLDDPALMDSVASAARIAIFNVRLQAEVRRQVAEVAASRLRIVETGDAQRRRLELELRDRVERRLIGVGGSLELLRNNDALSGDAAAVAEFHAVGQELREALADVQRLAAGIHPALLMERGLEPALSALAGRTPLRVDLEVSGERLSADLEAAVYFVCSEALTNVAKYARASLVSIEVVRNAGGISVTVADDGVGGADPAGGSGLRGLTDRIEALGGWLRVESPPGAGTRIVAEIPSVAGG
jgi:signal transduction histidine kinase